MAKPQSLTAVTTCSLLIVTHCVITDCWRRCRIVELAPDISISCFGDDANGKTRKRARQSPINSILSPIIMMSDNCDPKARLSASSVGRLISERTSLTQIEKLKCTRTQIERSSMQFSGDGDDLSSAIKGSSVVITEKVDDFETGLLQ